MSRQKRNFSMMEERPAALSHKAKMPRPHLAQELREHGQKDIADSVCYDLRPWARRSAYGYGKRS